MQTKLWVFSTVIDHSPYYIGCALLALPCLTVSVLPWFLVTLLEICPSSVPQLTACVKHSLGPSSQCPLLDFISHGGQGLRRHSISALHAVPVFNGSVAASKSSLNIDSSRCPEASRRSYKKNLCG